MRMLMDDFDILNLLVLSKTKANIKSCVHPCDLCSLWPVKLRRRRISGDGGQESGGQDAAEEMDLLDTSGHPVKY